MLCGIPTIGVGKTVFDVDGIREDKVLVLTDPLTRKGQAVNLVGESGRVWGAAIKPNNTTKMPLIISQGHLISLETSLAVVRKCLIKKIPEPIRQADLRSRKIVSQEPAKPRYCK